MSDAVLGVKVMLDRRYRHDTQMGVLQMLAGFIGFEVIRRVSPLLHTPLMSLTNALDAIAVVGAILLAGRHESKLAFWLGMIAIVAATSNIVGGFLITDRMLRMFKSSGPKKS